MENMKGFDFEGKRIFHIDGQGKDISFNRWRTSLYYAPGFAITHFMPTEKEYNDFITANSLNCFDDYNVFKESYNGEETRAEFKIGDLVTFKPYEKAIPAKIVEIVPSNKVTFFDDDRVWYRLTGTNPKQPLLSICTGNSIVESTLYNKNT